MLVADLIERRLTVSGGEAYHSANDAARLATEYSDAPTKQAAGATEGRQSSGRAADQVAYPISFTNASIAFRASSTPPRDSATFLALINSPSLDAAGVADGPSAALALPRRFFLLWNLMRRRNWA